MISFGKQGCAGLIFLKGAYGSIESKIMNFVLFFFPSVKG